MLTGMKAVRSACAAGALVALAGCATLFSRPSFQGERIDEYVVLGAGVTDLSILAGPPSRWGAAYSVADDVARQRERVFLFDMGCDGTLDVVSASRISEKSEETAACYWGKVTPD